jgi:4-coumarate--CoA ligase
MPSFDFLKMLTYIQKYRVTAITAVPPIVVAIAKHPAVKKFDLSSVESIGCGAAPLSDEVTDEALRNWPEGAVVMRQGWGMTEVTCTAMGWDARTTSKSSSVGELCANVHARIMAVDGSGEITAAKTRGELWVSGPTVMKGYWNRAEATRDTMHVDANGTRWLKTGDVAEIDEYAPGGLWRIVDRIKELIKVKGNQVAPAELEGLLLEHKDVDDAAVVGVTINGEELPRAYVVVNNGKAKGQDIAKWVESRVTHYKRLKGGVILVQEVPKNPVGYIIPIIGLRKFGSLLTLRFSAVRQDTTQDTEGEGGARGGRQEASCLQAGVISFTLLAYLVAWSVHKCINTNVER